MEMRRRDCCVLWMRRDLLTYGALAAVFLGHGDVCVVYLDLYLQVGLGVAVATRSAKVSLLENAQQIFENLSH